MIELDKKNTTTTTKKQNSTRCTWNQLSQRTFETILETIILPKKTMKPK